ncbi:MAG: RluA family pseudouridine synthase [Anaerolineaceae bacterium]|nr:RluA family pseudouridine synthase [Anaerolineaceae bacterium]
MMELLYQDNDLIAINKPSGLSTLPEGWDSSKPHVRSIVEVDFGPLWIVHRLDKETSGVLLLARNAAAHKSLNDQFANRQIKKMYSALVFGHFPKTASCALPLRINGDRRHRTTVDHVLGKPASTDFEAVEYIEDCGSWINAYPKSGYTHQIRFHCLSLGFPILGDPLYFTAESKTFSNQNSITRTMLHASQITFTHPITNNQMTLSAPLPEDFQNAITSLIK